MRKYKIGSMELSVNSIVILVIAVVLMGLILGFIRTKFSEVSGSLVTNEPDPTPSGRDDPMTVSRETVGIAAGSQTVIKVSMTNPLGYDLANLGLQVTCPGLTPSITYSSIAKTLASGTTSTYLLTLSAPRGGGKRSALCTIAPTMPLALVGPVASACSGTALCTVGAFNVATGVTQCGGGAACDTKPGTCSNTDYLDLDAAANTVTCGMNNAGLAIKIGSQDIALQIQ